MEAPPNLKLSTLKILVDHMLKEYGDLEVRDDIDNALKGLEVVEHEDFDSDDCELQMGQKYVRFMHFHWSDFPKHQS